MVRGNRGQVLVLVALAIFALLGLAALGIDVGYMYSVRHELQRCADTGALAGASSFIEPGNAWSSNLADPVMVEADRRARDYASRDLVLTSPLKQPASDNEIQVFFDAGPDRIRVITQRSAPLFFARIFGKANQVIWAEAIAEATVADSNLQCLKPWGIPLPWIDNGLGAPYDNNYKYDNVVGVGAETVMQLDDIPPGFPMILKVGEPFRNPNSLDNVSSLQQESGHFFALSICNDSGGNDYRDRIRNICLDNCTINEGDGVDLKTGNMVGPTKQGVDDLIALDPAAHWSPGAITTEYPYGEPNVTDSVGINNDHNWKNSPRLIKIPLYDPNELLHQGNTQMTVVGFGGFWLEGYDTKQGTVIGYYIQDSTSNASSSTGTSPNQVVKFLRLVK